MWTTKFPFVTFSVRHNYVLQKHQLDNLVSHSRLKAVTVVESLVPWRCGFDLKCENFKHNMGTDVFSIQPNITPKWMPDDFI